MRRRHESPFGAQVREGGVRFRLWAPAARRVDLVLDGREVPMPRTGGGWYELDTEAGGGSRYRYRIDGGLLVPDPASRFQPEDVNGPSEVIAPLAFDWQDEGWRGRPWKEAVFYELHVGTFSPEGTYAGVAKRLPHLRDLGVTAVELMPVADFAGRRNWGYDGVLHYAPDSAYGRPEDLKALVQAAHAHGLMIFLDVVYNHFGPEGNYLHRYAPAFFTTRHRTPWGDAINYDGEGSRVVRDFFIHNALYWLLEYGFDGLRFDAVHGIVDDSREHILAELARRVRQAVGSERQVHLVLENDANEARWLLRDYGDRAPAFDAQWDDDWHHCVHVLLTGEDHQGYYRDYADDPAGRLLRCATEGFAYQGEASAHRDGKRRGEASRHLPSSAYVNSLQNPDPAGNRARGERLSRLAEPRALDAAALVLLLSPQPPLLFMGEEWRAGQPFLFFCDFNEDLGAKVRKGRMRELARFPGFAADPARIPDPNSESTFRACVLSWEDAKSEPGRTCLELHRRLLRLRSEVLAPRLPAQPGARTQRLSATAFRIEWTLSDGSRLCLLANLGPRDAPLDEAIAGRSLISVPAGLSFVNRAMPGWSAAFFLLE
jgi:malto-oligosyltrehalose trehalohydrolase